MSVGLVAGAIGSVEVSHYDSREGVAGCIRLCRSAIDEYLACKDT